MSVTTKSPFKAVYAKSTLAGVMPILKEISRVRKIPLDALEAEIEASVKSTKEAYSKCPDFATMVDNLYNSEADLMYSKYKVAEALDDDDLVWDGKIFKELCAMVILENSPALVPMKNSFSSGGWLPTFVVYGSIDWYSLEKQGRISEAQKPDTAWCDPNGLMAFNSDFLEQEMQTAKLMGTTAPKIAKYVSGGGNIPDYWVVVEFIIIHEILHFVRNDHFFGANMKALTEIEPDAGTRHEALNIMGDMINNHTIVSWGYPQLLCGMFSETINYEHESNYCEMFKRITKQLRDMGRAGRENNNNTMDDHVTDEANQQADNKGQQGQDGQQGGQQSQNGNQQGQQGQDGQDGQQGQGSGRTSGKRRETAGSKNTAGERTPRDAKEKTDNEQSGVGKGSESDKKAEKDNASGDEGQSGGQDGDQKQDGKPSGSSSSSSSGSDSSQSGESGDQKQDGKAGGSKDAKMTEDELNKAIQAMDEAHRDQERNIAHAGNQTAEKRSAGVDLDAVRQAASKERENAKSKTAGKSVGLDIDFSGGLRNPAKSWEAIVREMVMPKKELDESYAVMDASGAARVSMSARTGQTTALSPGLIKQETGGENKILFVFDNSGSVFAHIKDANAQLWKLIKRGKIGDSLLLRFSDKFDLFQFFPKDKKAIEVTTQNIHEIAVSKKMPTTFKNIGAKIPFASVLATASSAGTQFSDEIANVCIAALKSGWGVLIFSDSDIIQGSANLSNLKKVASIAKKTPKKFGIVMNNKDDFNKLIGAIGSNPRYTCF